MTHKHISVVVWGQNAQGTTFDLSIEGAEVTGVHTICGRTFVADTVGEALDALMADCDCGVTANDRFFGSAGQQPGPVQMPGGVYCPRCSTLTTVVHHSINHVHAGTPAATERIECGCPKCHDDAMDEIANLCRSCHDVYGCSEDHPRCGGDKA